VSGEVERCRAWERTHPRPAGLDVCVCCSCWCMKVIQVDMQEVSEAVLQRAGRCLREEQQAGVG
jgi:hypothetical protein